MNKYISRILMPLTFLMIAIIVAACSYEILEATTGKVLRYSFEVAEKFGLIVNNEATDLYYWELDVFRITVHTSFLLMGAAAIIYFTSVYRFKHFDRSVAIITLLSISIGVNIPFMAYNFLFLINSGYLITVICWILSMCSIILCSITIYYLKKYSKSYRNYTLELKAMFINIPNVDIIGYFSHDNYSGIIKYCEGNKPLFTIENNEYIIYVNSYNIKEFENDFILKLGYWSYYIDKVVSRIKNKELDYHDNALIYSKKLLEEFQQNKKGNK